MTPGADPIRIGPCPISTPAVGVFPTTSDSLETAQRGPTVREKTFSCPSHPVSRDWLRRPSGVTMSFRRMNMLGVETAKAVATLVVTVASQDVMGAAGSVARLAALQKETRRSTHESLEPLIRVEFGHISRDDIAAVDEAVAALIGIFRIDGLLAASRPSEVVDDMMKSHGAQIRATLLSEDLGALFDRFLFAAVTQIGRAARLLPGYAVDAATTARVEVAELRNGISELDAEVERLTRRREEGQWWAVDLRGASLASAGYRRALAGYVPADADPRTNEIARLRTFVTGDHGQWWAWRGEAWSGKTTLMALALQALEHECDVVPFFINGRQVSARRVTDFTERTIPRLIEICGEGIVAATPGFHSFDVFGGYLITAAKASAAAGRRLLLLVDGLDEDAGEESILSAIPVHLPSNVRVVVSSRPRPLPRDIHADHPLHEDAVWHDITSSLLAVAARSVAEDDVGELLADPLGRMVAELLAVAGAPLTAPDLVELTQAPPATVRRLVSQRAGRCLQEMPIASLDPRDGDGGAERGYVLGHQEILRQVIVELSPQVSRAEDGANWDPLASAALTQARLRILEWADCWEAQNWPPNTPRYLVREYPQLLIATGDHRRLTSLVTQPARRNLLIRARGVPWLTQEELTAAIELAAQVAPIDLKTLAKLSAIQTARQANTYFLDRRMPEAWARIGRVEYAAGLCNQLDEFNRREAHARLLRLALLSEDANEVARLRILLAPHPDVIEHVERLVADGPPSGRASAQRVIPSDELPAGDEWDVYVTAGASPEDDLSEDLEGLSEEESLATLLIMAAKKGDAATVAGVAQRMNWDCASFSGSGRLTGYGGAMARAIVRLGVAKDVLPALRSMISGTDLGTDPTSPLQDEDWGLSPRAENAAVMLAHLALALRRTGEPAIGDEVIAWLAGDYVRHKYLKEAAIESAEAGDYASALRYLKPIQTREVLSENLATIATIAAWSGASCATTLAKAAEACGHDVFLAEYGAVTLHSFSKVLLDVGLHDLQPDLLTAAATLRRNAQDPNWASRLDGRIARQISDAWPAIDGPGVLATIGDQTITSLTYTHRALESLRLGRVSDLPDYFRHISDGEDQSWVARAVARQSLDESHLAQLRLESPEWAVLAIDQALAEILKEDASASTDPPVPFATMPPAHGTHLESAIEAIELVENSPFMEGAGVQESIELFLHDTASADNEKQYLTTLFETIRTSSMLELVWEIIDSTNPDLLRQHGLSPLTKRALAVGDDILAGRIAATTGGLEADDARRAMVDHFLGNNDELEAGRWARTMTADYYSADAFRDIAIHALRAGRPQIAESVHDAIPPGYGEARRDIRRVQLELATQQDEAERIVAAQLSDSLLNDEETLRMLATVSADALVSAARLLMDEFLARHAAIASDELIDTLLTQIEGVAATPREI